MCLAIPGKVIDIDSAVALARIDYNGLAKTASTMLMPEVQAGDYVLVHAGFIIQIIDEQYGRDLSELTRELGLL
ncbi:MAG: HypC/HybG/HupF family hydrogenase formation chaperone [Clostridia bacterium]|nr:HypC/HybG/HupF family hydrogenase formation chaperone [Clostridia bacterium]